MAKYPKKPKKPKMSASPKVWKKFEQRMKDWEAKCREIDKAEAEKARIAKKYS